MRNILLHIDLSENEKNCLDCSAADSDFSLYIGWNPGKKWQLTLSVFRNGSEN